MSHIPFKLQNLYSDLDRLKSSGEDVVADIRAEINNLELEYLKEKVIPQIARALAEKISGLHCEIDFSLQFNGESKIDYSLFTSSSSVLIRETLDANDLNTTTIANVLEQSYTSSEKSLEENEIQENLNISPSFSAVSIKDYSKKAFVIYGDTKPYADFFKSHGGYFNPRLRGGAGWVFSKKRKNEICEFLNLKSSDENTKESIDSTVENSGVPQTMTYKPNEATESIYQHFSSLIKDVRIRTDNNIGCSTPHKAIMLLAIFESIYYGTLRENKIYFNPNLISRYERLWKEYVPSHIKFKSNPSAPYIHLDSEPFYSLCLIRSNFDFYQNWNPQQVRRCVRYSHLDKRLFSIIPHKFHSFKKLLVETFLDFKNRESKSEPSILSSNNFQISNHPEKGFNLKDYKKYLLLLESTHGRKYSPSTISVYSSALKSTYMVGKVKKYLPSGNLFEISDYNDLNWLYDDVLRDTNNKLAASSYAIALKLYIQFFCEVEKESFILSSPTESLTPSSNKRYSSSFARKVPLNCKLKRIITPNFSLSDDTPTAMLVNFVERIGAQTIYNLKIPYLGRYLVDTSRHPKYIGQSKYVDGYWVNTCSSTAKKIEQIQSIADKLGMDIKFITE